MSDKASAFNSDDRFEQPEQPEQPEQRKPPEQPEQPEQRKSPEQPGQPELAGARAYQAESQAGHPAAQPESQAEKPADAQEKISYTGPDGVEVEVPIYRAGMPEVFVALQPPTGQPYIMAARDMPPQQIVDFFVPHVAEVEELRTDMCKRFAKTSSDKCRYMTGDVAYVMGRPFQLRVYPLGQSNMKKAARGRATAKFSLNPAVSLITLYVVHPRNYDEAKTAFNSYAEGVILRNAAGLARDFTNLLSPGAKVPTVRMRAMRDRWTSDEAGALWLSTDLVPYPPDCLVFAIWRELEKKATIPENLVREHFERVLPGWRAAQRMLSDRAKPYSNQ